MFHFPSDRWRARHQATFRDVTFGGGSVQNGTLTGQWVAPTGDTSNYLVTQGGQTTTASFATPGNVFGFYWGSIDAYNTLTLTTSGGPVVITGLTLAALTPVTFGTTSDYVEISGLGTITGASFSTTFNSFEVDNLEVATAIPEASTWAMMLLGFAGVGFLSYRNRSRRFSFRMA